ncbi:MOSC N-terminal beta barrel domain-containing protein [Mycolicibacter sp. MYC123]|uniref:MOSC N-terminal beta barrel domain-containing protein n=1 Tax=[Mycobacterium] zoologicum TaxID=2872311 RepID=A0ABU5YK60_9MYCO|nr:MULTISPECIES: MOSC N-terminal beta barrel domain-containing protein [unclassified Mycolicibacter]MEB3049869.1 MOSC N-terminal beta barrel domain-containing protein [Mycolicibacter sp. MYC123]MEB3062248.1 MOSC N-terminal beta barrel domain-containing protein [Mycolicibacter sp. MYC101]
MPATRDRTDRRIGSAAASVHELAVYPLKGLTAQTVSSVAVHAGHGFPHDREWALARPDGEYRCGSDKAVHKSNFFVLLKEDRLAGVTTYLDVDTQILEVRVRQHVVLVADVTTSAGKRAVERFFARMLDCPDEAGPILAREPDRRFTDAAIFSDAFMNAVSVINLESIRDLSRRSEHDIDHRRFRANIYIEGTPAFAEAALVDKDFSIGAVRLRGLAAIPRCAATEVNPSTAARDLAVPKLLVEHYGHANFGIWAEVTKGAVLRQDDPVMIASCDDNDLASCSRGVPSTDLVSRPARKTVP